MTDLPFACRCGTVRGTVRELTPKLGNHIVCYCADCRAFSQLGGGDALDASGGTELLQTSAGNVTIESGADRLACVRMTERGPHRWIATCCDTPMANTLGSPALPFATMVAPVVGASRAERDAAVGPSLGAGFPKSALGEPLEPPVSVPRMLARFARLMLWARRRGHQRRSPFHEGGAPISEPRVMSDDELAELKARPIPATA